MRATNDNLEECISPFSRRPEISYLSPRLSVSAVSFSRNTSHVHYRIERKILFTKSELKN